MQCEKHSKKEEALAKLNEGVKFDEVARNFSEDKARAGELARLQASGIKKESPGVSNGFQVAHWGGRQRVALTPSLKRWLLLSNPARQAVPSL